MPSERARSASQRPKALGGFTSPHEQSGCSLLPRRELVPSRHHSLLEERVLMAVATRLPLQPRIGGFGEGAAAVVVDGAVEIERPPARAERRLRAPELRFESHPDDLPLDPAPGVDAVLELILVEAQPLPVDGGSEGHEA